MLTVVPDPAGGDRQAGGSAPSGSLIDEFVREGARRMLAEALQAEVDAYIAQFADQRDERGRRLVVRNGSHQGREVLTSAGAIEVRAPRVNDIGRSHPRPTEVAAGKADITPEQHAELAQARAELLRLAEVLTYHEWWSTVSDRTAAKAALRVAATNRRAVPTTA